MGSQCPSRNEVHDLGLHRVARVGCGRSARRTDCATHWSCYPELEAHGATPTTDRVVEHLDQRIITSAGVSAGIDMALRLTELLADRTAAEGRALMIEYDPQPSVDCGCGQGRRPGCLRVIEYARLRS